MATVWSWSSSASVEPESFVGTAPSINTNGSYGERYLWPETTTQSFMRKTGLNLQDHQIRFIYSLANPATTSSMIMSANDTASAFQYRIDITAAGLLRLRADSAGGTVQVAQGATALAFNAEHRFEISRVGSTVTVKAYRVADNALRDTISGTVGNAPITQVWLGNNIPVTGTLGVFTFDEIVVNTTSGDVGPVAGTLTVSASVSPAAVGQGSTLTLTISATGGSGSYSYSVTDWGDGSSSPDQSSNVFTKSIGANATLGTKTIKYTVTG